MMHMSYWFGTNVGDLIFQGLTVTTVLGFVSTCAGVLSLAILFEAVKVGLVSARQKAAALALNEENDGCPNEAALLLDNCPSPVFQQSSFIKFIMIFNQIFLFTSHEILSYILMLLVMTYNGYFTLVAVLGAGIGFFLFSPSLVEISRRRGGTFHSPTFCTACNCEGKLKESEEREEDSSNMHEVAATNEAQVVGDSGEKPTARISEVQERVPVPHCCVQVAMVHSPNEEVC